MCHRPENNAVAEPGTRPALPPSPLSNPFSCPHNLLATSHLLGQLEAKAHPIKDHLGPRWQRLGCLLYPFLWQCVGLSHLNALDLHSTQGNQEEVWVWDDEMRAIWYIPG